MQRVTRLLLVLLLVLAACDGETAPGETAAGEGAPPPQDEGAFSAQAEAICQGGRVELDRERGDLFDDLPIEPEDAQQSFERAGALLATQVTELRALELPEDGRADAAAWLDELEQGASAYQEAGESAERAGEVAGGPDPLEDALLAADDLGLRACGTDPGLATDELGELQPVTPTE